MIKFSSKFDHPGKNREKPHLVAYWLGGDEDDGNRSGLSTPRSQVEARAKEDGNHRRKLRTTMRPDQLANNYGPSPRPSIKAPSGMPRRSQVNQLTVDTGKVYTYTLCDKLLGIR